MEAKEIRLGNLLEVYGNFWHVDSIVNNGQIELYFKENDDYDHWLNAKPIPITEEILLKLGFDKGKLICQRGNGYDYQPEYPKTYYRDYCLNGLTYRIGEFHWKDANGINKDPEESVLYNDNSLGIEIKYVHQLQNLYFALCGKELTLNT